MSRLRWDFEGASNGALDFMARRLYLLEARGIRIAPCRAFHERKPRPPPETAPMLTTIVTEHKFKFRLFHESQLFVNGLSTLLFFNVFSFLF
jgi:hypothetical protein